MKGMVINHNDIDDSHTCSYAFTDHQTGDVSDFGVITGLKEQFSSKNPGAEVLRKALRLIMEQEEEEITIFNHSEYTPQLEISRFPDNVREKIYQEKQFEIESSASGTSSITGQFLVNSAIDFVSMNYSKFDNPVTTNRIPRPSGNTDSVHRSDDSKYKYNYNSETHGTYCLYTDASYHPEKQETSIGSVVVGENGGMYAKGKEVSPQIAPRAELLALLSGIKKIQNNTHSCNIVAYTDCETVVNSIEDGVTIDNSLDKKAEELFDKDNFEVDLRCISRNSNSLADSVAKVARSCGEFQVGSFSK